MAYPSYPVYKDSGIPAIGQVPAHWEIKRNKHIFEEVDERSATGEEELLTVSHITGVTPRAEKSVYMFLAESFEGYKICRTNDLVINTMWAWMGALGITGYEGIVSPSYNVYRLRKRQISQYIPKYLDLLYRVPAYVCEITRHSKGVWSSRLRLYPDSFFEMYTPSPSPSEQRAIVAFLDRETAQTDELIDEQRRLIELLQERHAALIGRAVTQGLDPAVPMKDSGIEWLGEMPAHWETKQVRYIAESLQTGPFGSQLHSSDYVTDGTPIVNPAHMKDGHIEPDWEVTVDDETCERLKHQKLHTGDIVFARRGELGRCALVTQNEEGWLCGTGSLRMRPKLDSVYPPFLNRALSTSGVSEWLSLESVGTTMDNLNTSILARLLLPVPPLPEQHAIAAYLDRETARIDAAVAEVERAIAHLEEYRAALIAAAVTGKIDVREAAPC